MLHLARNGPIRRRRLWAEVAVLGVLLAACGGVPVSRTELVYHWGAYSPADAATPQTTQSKPTPLALAGTVVQVASSNTAQYTLLSNGIVYAWGLGSDGQLGNGSSGDSMTTPVRVQFPPGVKIAFLPTDVMPYNTGLAVDTSGNAWGWGLNTNGSLCLGTHTEYLTPTELPLHDVTALAGAGYHSLYDSHGTVYACGDNRFGDLGDGNYSPISTLPVKVSGLSGDKVKVLVSSWADSGALLANGTYLDWGYDQNGQLGDGTVGEHSDIPVKVPLPFPVSQVVLGGSIGGNGQTLVMLSNGSLYAWGADSYGQLGDGKTTDEPSPIRFYPPPNVIYAHLATGGATSYAVTTTGKVYSWGYNANYEVGNGGDRTEFIPQLIWSGVSLISATADDVVIG